MHISTNYYLNSYNYSSGNIRRQQPQTTNSINPSFTAKHLTKTISPSEQFKKRLIELARRYEHIDENLSFAQSLVDYYNNNGAKKAIKVLKTFAQITTLKNNGLNFCNDMQKAVEIAQLAIEYPEAYSAMSKMTDKFGRPRFNIDDYDESNMETFNENTKLMEGYADLCDVNRHPRLSSVTIANLIGLKDQFTPEEIQTALDMEHGDGVHLFERGDIQADVIKRINTYPKEFKELISIKIPVYGTLSYLSYTDISDHLLELQKQAPEGLKVLLSMPNDNFMGTRFGIQEIETVDPMVLKYIEKYPKSFMALADIRYDNCDKERPYRFNLNDISEFIFSFGIDNTTDKLKYRKIPNKIMEYIGLSASINALENNYFCSLRARDIVISYSFYEQKPAETIKALKLYCKKLCYPQSDSSNDLGN